MSRFVVNLDEQEKKNPPIAAPPPGEMAFLSEVKTKSQPPRKGWRALKVFGILLALLLAAFAAGSFFYWQSVKKTPSYSLALLVDAARRDDKAEMEKLIDSDAAVDNFVPQITDKAVELYGKNLPPAQIEKVKQAAAPLMPSIKQRAKEELPRVIREKTAPFENVPYWAIALFANRAVEITQDGDTAQIKSNTPERPLELTMKKNGDLWRVTALKDDVLAQKIAEKIGQELIAAATKNGIRKAGEKFGVQNLDEMLKNVDLFR